MTLDQVWRQALVQIASGVPSHEEAQEIARHALRGATTCMACRGTGEVLVGDETYECSECGGNGGEEATT